MVRVDSPATQRVGAIEATTLRTGRLHLALEFAPGPDWRTPDVRLDDRGRGIIDVVCLLVRTPDALIIVDPSCWESDVHDERFDIDFLKGPSLESCLGERGIACSDVTHVVLTHLHPDHVNGVAQWDGVRFHPRFPAATHLVSRADRRELAATPWLQEIIEPWIETLEGANLIQYVSGDLDLVDGVSLLAAPGESPGHQVLRAAGADGALYFLGDLCHVRQEFLHPDWGPAHADLELLAQSRRRVFDDATGRNSKLVFSHAAYPGWGTVVQTGSGWDFRYLEAEDSSESGSSLTGGPADTKEQGS